MAEVLDDKEYAEYKKLETSTPVYKWLRTVPDINRKKARFFSEGFRENPDLSPEIDVREARARTWGYTALKDQIGSGNAEQVVKDAYLPVLDDNILNLEILYAAHNRDLDAFVQANESLYGEPEKLVFDTLCLFLRGLAAKHDHEPANMFIAQAAKEVLEVLPDTWATAGKVWPNAGEFRKLKNIYADFFDEMYQGIELPEQASGREVCGIIERVLGNLDYDYKVVAQDKGVSTMAVNQKTREVKVPPTEIYEKSRLKGLIGHEVRVHIEETCNGEQQPLMLLGRGLKGSDKAGEGKGVNVEMVAYDYADEFLQSRRFFDIARRHISIGLARGLDGNGPRDFSEVFGIVNALDRLWELTHSATADDPKAAVVQALDRTWELLTNRTLKGVVGKGAAFYKDKIYAEGRIDQGQMLIRNPNAYPYLNSGHHDLTQPSHVDILKRIGTLPSEIEIKRPRSK